MNTLTQSVELVKQRFNNASKFRQPLTQKWIDWYEKWRNYLPANQDSYRSNLFIPYSFQVVETIVPRLIVQKPTIAVLPREPQDEKNASILEKVISYFWDYSKMDEKLEIMVRSGLIYGTSYLKTDWYDDKPRIENVDILDLYIDPDATCLYNAQFVIYRTMRTIEEIKANKNYKNLDLLKGLKSDNDQKEKTQRFSVMGLPDPNQYRDKKSDKIEILEYWEDNRVIVVAGQQVLLRDEENPFPHKKKPFVVFNDYIVPNEFYGVGEIEHIAKMQEEANTLRNQIVDNLSLINNRMWKVRRAGGIDPRKIKSKPGGMIPVTEMTDIEPFETIPLPTQSFNLGEFIKGDIQQTTAVTDFQTGTGVTGTQLNQTATGISLIQEAGNLRFRLKMRHLEETLQCLSEQILANIQAFVQKPFVIRVVGQQGNEYQTVNPADLQGNYDLIPEMGADEPVDKASKRKQFMDLLTLLGQPQFAPLINWQEMLKKLLEKWDIDNVDELLNQQMAGGDAVSQMMQQKTPEEIDAYMSTLSPEDQKVLAQAMQQKTQ